MNAQKMIIKIKHDGKIGSKVNVLLDGDPKIDIKNFNAIKGDNIYVYEVFMKMINILHIPTGILKDEYKEQTGVVEIYHSGVRNSEVEMNFFTSPKINPEGNDPKDNIYIVILLQRMLMAAEEHEAAQHKVINKKKEKENNGH